MADGSWRAQIEFTDQGKPRSRSVANVILYVQNHPTLLEKPKIDADAVRRVMQFDGMSPPPWLLQSVLDYLAVERS